MRRQTVAVDQQSRDRTSAQALAMDRVIEWSSGHNVLSKTPPPSTRLSILKRRNANLFFPRDDGPGFDFYQHVRQIYSHASD